MNNDTHPALEQLAGFSEDPAALEYTGLRRHLTACAECRQRLDQLHALSRSLLTTPPTSAAAALPDSLLQAIENDQLDDDQHRALNNDPAALKAALHYAGHATAMRNHFAAPISAMSEPPAETRSGTTTGQPQSPSLLQRLWGWRPPAWSTIPASAAAAFALALAVLPPTMPPPDASPTPATLVIASYTDRPVLERQGSAADLPGMGFFHAADTLEVPFDNLRLHYSRADGLSANWPPVKNAQSYHLRLSRTNTDSQQVIAEIDVKQPQAHFPQLQPAPGHYQWLLTGQNTDGSRFRASGGFVVNRL